MTAAGISDGFAAKFTAAGVHVWSRKFSGEALPAAATGDGLTPAPLAGRNFSDEQATDIVTDASGDVIVVGRLIRPVPGLPSESVTLVAKLAGATGVPLWSKTFSSAGSHAFPNGVAVDGRNDVLMTGSLKGTIDFGGRSLTGADDIFVVKLSASAGALQWVKSFGGAGFDSGQEIAIDARGDALVVGGFRPPVDFGGGALTNGAARDAFVLKLSGADGTHVWSRAFGTTGLLAQANAVTVDREGEVFVAGQFNSGTLNFGGGIVLDNFGKDHDIFVTRLAAVEGSPVWAKQVGRTLDDIASSLALDSGHLFMTGDAGVSGSFQDVFVTKLSAADGAQLWTRSFGSPGDDVGTGIAVIGNEVTVTGWFVGTPMYVVGTPLWKAGEGADIFLVRLKR